MPEVRNEWRRPVEHDFEWVMRLFKYASVGVLTGMCSALCVLGFPRKLDWMDNLAVLSGAAGGLSAAACVLGIRESRTSGTVSK